MQRDYRAIFDEAKNDSPVLILNNNKPDVAIIGVKYLEEIIAKANSIVTLIDIGTHSIYR